MLFPTKTLSLPKFTDMLKIGVLGAGHLGKIHIKCIKQIDRYELVGFYDQDANTANRVAEETNVRNFASIDELIDSVDVATVLPDVALPSYLII